MGAATISRVRQLRLTSRQVNLLLELLILTALVSGVVSWIVPLAWARAVIVIHAISGLLIVLVAPVKIRGPVRAGFKRRRSTRWVSTAFGLLVMATVGLGLIHATGIWSGVGYWSALWTHQLLGFLALPVLVWHIATRPVRPTITDLDRRGFLTTSATAGVALGLIVAQELLVDATGLPGQDRAGTGSLEVGSFDPTTMPQVQWIDDRAPAETDPSTWALTVAGTSITIDELWDLSQPLVARLDCTGGWFADQRWNVVALSELLPTEVSGRSLHVTSATNYARLFPLGQAATLHLAVGYDGEPLRRGHGAPVRLVAPGRRGPHWVKWVTEVAVSDRPAWLQLPLPPT